MNLGGRVFRNVKTGHVVTVKDSFDDIAIMMDMSKLRVSELLDPSLYIPFDGESVIKENKSINLKMDNDTVDPGSFFGDRDLNNLAEQLKSIPLENLPEDSDISHHFGGVYDVSDESAIIMTDELSEREELARKYSQQYGVNISPVEQMSNQEAAINKMLNGETESVVRIDVETNKAIENPYIENDPIFNMFKNVKRKNDFNMILEIQDKIPRIDFIEMMEDSYEVSIIDYLTEQITNKILSDIPSIKKKVKDKLQLLVYGEIQDEDNNDDSIVEMGREEEDTESLNTESLNTESLNTESLDTESLDEWCDIIEDDNEEIADAGGDNLICDEEESELEAVIVSTMSLFHGEENNDDK